MAERRRLERDLHDGAQQRLVALSLQLGSRAPSSTPTPAAAGLLDRRARASCSRALEELRELARGIHPAVLTDRGLGAAIEALAERAPLPVQVCRRPRTRLPAAVEAAAYFVVAESLANVAKYACAEHATRARRARERRRRRRGQRRRGRRRRSGARHRAARPRRPPRRARRPSRGRSPARGGHRVRAEIPCDIASSLADDSVLLREGVARLLEDAGIEVVGQAGDAEDLLRKVGAHKPDVAVVDVRMPPTHTDEGLRAAARDPRPTTRGTGVLVLSQYIEEAYALELLSDNAEGVGYLLKDRVADVERFVDACGASGRAARALDPEVVARLVGRRRREDPLSSSARASARCSG